MNEILFQLKQDAFRKARGGYARFLNIYCKACEEHVLLYQKDGPGPLKRLYCDRIVAPLDMVIICQKTKISDIPHLVCKKCKSLLASPYIYEKESRFALLIKEESITKKLTKGVYKV